MPGGPFTMGTSTEPWALDNERPAHTVTVPAFYLDTTPVTNAAYQEFIADGGYEDPRWWRPAGWDAPAAGGPGRAAVLAARGERLGAAGSASPSRCRPPSRSCTCPGTRRRPTPRGRAAGCPPRRSGRRRPGFDPATGRSRRFPWGDEDPTPDRANLGQRHLQPAAAGSYPAGASAVRGPAADRRRVGVDLQRLPALPGLHRLAVPGVLRGVLRQRVQGAARWLVRRRPGRLPGHVPQLGLPDPAADLRRLPHRPRRRGRRPPPHSPGSRRGDREPMCRHLAYLGPPATLAGAAHRPAVRAGHGRPGRRAASATGP